MGNRAVITTEAKDIGVYLHWNGGRDSVNAFLTYCKLKGYRCPESDCYGWARLCQVIANFFGGELSVGIDRYDRLDTDNGDNGVYVIKNWEIVDREFYSGAEQDNYDIRELLTEINKCQPISEQIDTETLNEEINKLLVKPITRKQIKAIHAVIGELGWYEERYRDLLKVVFGKDTCKDLTEEQASVIIEMLNKLKG